MKIAVFCLATLLAAGPLALAQEESASPAAPPETTTPDTTRSEPSVSVTTEKTASPSPKPKPSTSPSKSSSPAAPKSNASATPSTSSSPAAAMPVKKGTPEATIREIEDKWEASVKTHDLSIPQAYLADDYRGVSSKGKVMTKANLLSELKKDTDVYSSTKNGKIDVRVFGGQFAVATGVSTEVGKDKGGQSFKRMFRWTDVWVLRKDQWLCVATQSMLVQ